jgi:hypothetical protein
MLNSKTPLSILALDEVMVKFKGRVVFRQYIQEEEKIQHHNLQTV